LEKIIPPNLMMNRASAVFIEEPASVGSHQQKVRKEASGGRLERPLHEQKKRAQIVQGILCHDSYSYEFVFGF
jgi:hypothetical protein